MGRKLDALLGRNFKTSKFKTLTKLAVSRIGILTNQHQARYSHSRSDVVELLNLGHHEQALLRVDYLIKEQNMVDAFTIMEGYCNLLIERVMLIQKNKECPDELKEATSSLMFASSRCGEFPELLHIRGVLSSTFGKEFVARAVELRNSCSVHPKIIQKLSTRRPSLETKLKLLKEIASEKGITLRLEAMAFVDVNEKQDESMADKSAKLQDSDNEIVLDQRLTESIKARKKYRDVADAAQEAFESAAYAAAAARAAVELSRIGPQDSDPDDQSDPIHENEPKLDSDAMPDAIAFDKLDSESKEETMTQTSNELELNETEEKKQDLCIERTLSSSSSDISAEEKLSLEIFNADMEKAKEETQCEEPHDLSSDITQNEENSEDDSKLGDQSSKLKNTKSLNFEESLHSHVNKKWVSMRTRRDHRI
ncbi:Gag protease polyprotein [Hibiscus syriacus]|uniref:Gag protease polyprotein n=1 Tax=Hibiscus syriacus TaxID=106335 RepID=A0A6A3B1S5_HIBSY|nr:uncharacterized protein LOC120119202 [Hibiscus syriacus]KAE8709305.1 Gag protease polyprotein [Hibiscus syriacus]